MSACAVGQRHTSDSKLQQNFFEHQIQFEALRADVQADQKIEMIGLDTLRYAGRTFSSHEESPEMERLGFTKENWAGYRRRLQEIGVIQAFNSKDGVTFKVDGGTIWNGDSYKGYEYDLTPPDHQKVSLDGYRISEVDRDRYGNYSVHKSIKGHWYLYLFVSR